VDDQAAVLDTPDGSVVLLGCGHAGVINTLRHVQESTGARPVHAIIGGMHLINASPERVEWTMGALREYGVEILAPAHCTGARPQARLWSEFQDSWTPCSVGTRFEFVTGAAQ
jgi:7,8-dihydropterin-6-yl-methyl-4-(beta-D-ribofuranosyl)aminobenzene 5'-phosphate synthase